MKTQAKQRVRGILPSEQELRRMGLGDLVKAMRKRPELFAHIPGSQPMPRFMQVVKVNLNLDELASEERKERNLINRIKRKLAAENHRLHVARNLPDGREDPNTGRYYVVDDRNNLIASHCDLEDLGREIGAVA